MAPMVTGGASQSERAHHIYNLASLEKRFAATTFGIDRPGKDQGSKRDFTSLTGPLGFSRFLAGTKPGHLALRENHIRIPLQRFVVMFGESLACFRSHQQPL